VTATTTRPVARHEAIGDAAAKPADQVLEELGSSPRGLDDAAVTRRRASIGPGFTALPPAFLLVLAGLVAVVPHTTHTPT
jgi:hypothetical protein